MHRSLAAPAGACLAAAFLFGASTPLAKALLGSLGPWSLAGLLYVGGAIGAAPFVLAGGRPRLARADRLRLAGAVVFGGVLGPVLLLASLRAAPAGGIALLLNLETVATTALAAAFFREPLERRALAATGCVLLGSAVLAGPAGVVPWPAMIAVALACTCWALDNNWTATIEGLTPARITFVKGAVAGTTNLVLARGLDGTTAPFPGVAVIAGALLLGAFAYGASIALYIRGAQQLGAARSQLLFATAPFFGLGLATLFGHEPLTPGLVVAGLLMAAGAVFLARSHHAHEHVHEATEHVHRHRHDDGHHDHVHPGLPASVVHTHAHRHAPVVHAHPHVPDLHHRHVHERPSPPAA